MARAPGRHSIGLFNRKLSEVLLSEAGIQSELYAGEGGTRHVRTGW